MTSCLFGAVIQNATYFGSCKVWRYIFDYFNLKFGNVWDSITINWLSAMVTVFLSNPIWVLNTRMVNKQKNVFNKIILGAS